MSEFSLIVPEGETAVPQAFLNADARDSIAANGKESYTIDEAAQQLIRSSAGWGGVLGRGVTITYAFRADEPAAMPDDSSGFSRFNAAQIRQAELALAGWSDAGAIRFVRVGSGTEGEAAYANNATILFGNYSSGVSGASAFSFYPGSQGSSSRAGDVWVNSTFGFNQSPTVGNYGGMVLAHEIGHAIGLAHPSDYDASDESSPAYSTDASYYEDSRQYTVMSYFSESNTGGGFGGVYAAAPLLDDIAAIQAEYGANTSTRTGDTVYGFNSNADRPWFQAAAASDKLVFAVWDAGGRDTLDFSGYSRNQTIELRQGFFSSVGGLTGNVVIAKGADIENAIGGSGADSITGNSLANTLSGGAGADTLLGGSGGDTLSDSSGSNYLRGEDGADSITGGSGFDDINGNAGNDTANGGDGADWVVGGRDNDVLDGNAGDDIVYGNMGDDTCFGSDGADIVRGGQGQDSLSGGNGDDWLSGDRGDDTLTGGAGADTFHSFGDAGIDRILDFSRAQGDKVQLDAGSIYEVAQAGADVTISLTGGAQVILVGVSMASLTGGWLIVT